MSVLQSIVLAIIEGLTEFLPVSSTGHMIIASSVMGIASDPFTKTFTVAIQLGAILSVLVLYWKRFLPSSGQWGDLVEFYLKLLIAFIPAAVLGLLLNDYLDMLLENVTVVAALLIAGGVVFLFIDRIFHTNEATGTSHVSNGSALKIGLFQTLSLAPGVSRSAATIIGGLSQGLTRKAAAEFSFFLAFPTMLAATGYKLLKFYKAGGGFEPHQLQLLAIGNVVAFAVALLAIRSFVSFLTRHGFRLFGYYRIALGGTLLLLSYLGVELSIV